MFARAVFGINFNRMRIPRRQTPAYSHAWTPMRANGVLFLVALLAGAASAQFFLYLFGLEQVKHAIILDIAAARDGEVWRLLSQAFLHDGLMHFCMTIGVLYLAGRELEPIIGKRHTLSLGLLANTAAGATAMGTGQSGAVCGFSAGSMAILCACCMVLPGTRLPIISFVPLKIGHLAGFFCGLSVFASIAGYGTAWNPAGIMVGALLGLVWAKLLGFGQLQLRSEPVPIKQTGRLEDFISIHVDPILEKISNKGMRSLSRQERNTLQQASDKLQSRDGEKS
jgi:membrane associated rhomboid family serine protease